jgi:hypothetical protein
MNFNAKFLSVAKREKKSAAKRADFSFLMKILLNRNAAAAAFVLADDIQVSGSFNRNITG